ncbi:MAG TPA: LCP family protein [Actinomycetospora sp.]|uniref:LCP family protein n=1 Tax=Actinomycetospora sp. TaxID=1872135 RepID=UPI002F426F27
MAGPGDDRPGGFRMPRRGDTRPDGGRPGPAPPPEGGRARPGPPPAGRPAPGPAAPRPDARPAPPPPNGGRPAPPPRPPSGPPPPAPGGRPAPLPTKVAPVLEPDEAPGRGVDPDPGPPGGGADGLLERVRAAATKRVLVLVLAAASVLLLLVSGGVVLAARSIDSGLSRVDVIGTSFGSVLGTDQNILLVGLDSRTDSFGNPLPKDQLAALHAGASDSGGDSTDTIIVLHIPGGGGPATGFSIPRDSYVDLPDGFGKHKINSAYAYGSNAARSELAKEGVSGNDLTVQAGAAGAKTTIGAVESLTGLTITHYGAVNLAGFADISQAIGGVPVCLNSAVNDTFSGAKFKAGQQTVAGPQALAFVRQRHGLPGGDLDRARRQQVFLSSMAHTVLSSDTLTDSAKRNALVAAVDKAITVDRSLDVLSLATQLQGVSSGSIGFHTIPIVDASYDTGDDGEAVQVDPSAVQKYISDTVSGSTSSGSSAPASKASGGSSSSGSTTAAPAPAAKPKPAVPASDAGTAAPTVPCVN